MDSPLVESTMAQTSSWQTQKNWGIVLHCLRSNSGKYNSFHSMGDIQLCINIVLFALNLSHCEWPACFSLKAAILCYKVNSGVWPDLPDSGKVVLGRCCEHQLKVGEMQEAALCLFLILAVWLRRCRVNKAVLSENCAN